MEDVLDLYAEAPDPERLLVCFDETPVQLIGRGAPAGRRDTLALGALLRGPVVGRAKSGV